MVHVIFSRNDGSIGPLVCQLKLVSASEPPDGGKRKIAMRMLRAKMTSVTIEARNS